VPGTQDAPHLAGLADFRNKGAGLVGGGGGGWLEESGRGGVVRETNGSVQAGSYR
jgi:hypothetical protein